MAHLRELPSSFGGRQWAVLADHDGSFTMIDWPHAGAGWYGNSITGAEGLILHFCSDDAAHLKAELWRGYLADSSLNADERGAIRMLSLHNFLGFAAIRQDVSDSVTSTARALADATPGE